MGKGIPDRWEQYLPVGSPVPGTQFLPFKVPLKVDLCRKLPKDEWFTPEILVRDAPNLKAIIDLTNTNRYYNSQEFTHRGISHKKIMILGGRSGKLPPQTKVAEFFDAVDELLEMLGRDSDALIGVHCTHGLNRTGYLICKYMVSRMEIDPQEAINTFQTARGYPMERPIYVNDLLTTLKGIQNRSSEVVKSMVKSNFDSLIDYQRNHSQLNYCQSDSDRFSSHRDLRQSLNYNQPSASPYPSNFPRQFDNRRDNYNFYPENQTNWRSREDGPSRSTFFHNKTRFSSSSQNSLDRYKWQNHHSNWRQEAPNFQNRNQMNENRNGRVFPSSSSRSFHQHYTGPNSRRSESNRRNNFSEKRPYDN